MVLGILAVTLVALNDPVPPLLGKLAEGHVRRRAAAAGEFHHIVLAFGVGGRLPQFDGPLGQRLAPINGNDPSEAAAGGAGPDGMIETEQRRGGFAVFQVASGAMQSAGERHWRAGGLARPRLDEPQGQFAFAKMIGLLARLHKARPVGRGHPDAVLDDRQARGAKALEASGGILHRHHGSFQQETLVALPRNQGQRLFQWEFFTQGQIKGDQHFGLPGLLAHGRPDGCRRVFPHRLPALAAMELGDPGPKGLGVIGDLGHRAHGGTGGLDGVALLDGDGRGDALNAGGLWFVHPVQELARVRGEGFDVAPLAFGKERVKGQGTLARAAQPRDDHQLAQRDIQVDVFKIVLPHPPQADASARAGAHRSKRNPQQPGVKPHHSPQSPANYFSFLFPGLRQFANPLGWPL